VADERGADPLRGALLVVCALLLWEIGVSRRPFDWAPCAAPHSVQIVDGATRSVGCSALAPIQPPLVGSSRLLFGLPIDINRASIATLQHLPGIGPGRAHAIVEARCRKRFDNVASLMRVRGLGPATQRRLTGLIGVPEAGEPGCAQLPTLGGSRRPRAR
jgi:hypothetical protein